MAQEPTQDQRIEHLEKAVAELQKRLVGGERDTNHRLTMLLGIAAGQEADVKQLVLGQSDIKAGLGQVIESQREADTNTEIQLRAMGSRFEAIEMKIETQGQKLDQIIRLLSRGYPQGRE